MHPTPVSADASEQLVHGVPVSYVSRLASQAAVRAHKAAEPGPAPLATTALTGPRADALDQRIPDESSDS